MHLLGYIQALGPPLRGGRFSHRIPKTLPGPSQTPLNRSQVERYVRQALADLHDTVALRRNPLRDYVSKAIDELDPGAYADTRAARPYRVLQLRYVEGRSATEAARLLALSTSQYYREQGV